MITTRDHAVANTARAGSMDDELLPRLPKDDQRIRALEYAALVADMADESAHTLMVRTIVRRDSNTLAHVRLALGQARAAIEGERARYAYRRITLATLDDHANQVWAEDGWLLITTDALEIVVTAIRFLEPRIFTALDRIELVRLQKLLALLWLFAAKERERYTHPPRRRRSPKPSVGADEKEPQK